ncbi:MAG TPA: glycerol acyltransferase [Porticoccus sp.]|nr:glycerol acyltransferase [Porticoccus sp.]
MASNITQLKTTIFATPGVRTIFRWLSIVIMKLVGWRIVGKQPTDPKYILIAVPHTSNWDFPLFILLAFILRFDAHWMGKAALFPFPIKRLMIWLGGIPIDRSKKHNVVEQMVDYFASVDQLTVVIPPEGTRSKVDRWKTGFYHIALQAKIPLILGFVDGDTRQIGFGPKFMPTGDMDADLKEIQAFYANKRGINADNF